MMIPSKMKHLKASMIAPHSNATAAMDTGSYAYSGMNQNSRFFPSFQNQYQSTDMGAMKPLSVGLNYFSPKLLDASLNTKKVPTNATIGTLNSTLARSSSNASSSPKIVPQKQADEKPLPKGAADKPKRTIEPWVYEIAKACTTTEVDSKTSLYMQIYYLPQVNDENLFDDWYRSLYAIIKTFNLHELFKLTNEELRTRVKGKFLIIMRKCAQSTMRKLTKSRKSMIHADLSTYDIGLFIPLLKCLDVQFHTPTQSPKQIPSSIISQNQPIASVDKSYNQIADKEKNPISANWGNNTNQYSMSDLYIPGRAQNRPNLLTSVDNRLYGNSCSEPSLFDFAKRLDSQTFPSSRCLPGKTNLLNSYFLNGIW